jgi:signal transduction histidine kinase
MGSIYGAYMWGISMPSALLLFSLVIAVVGILFSSRAALVITLASCITILLLGIREIHNPDITLWKEYGIRMIDIISYIVIICISSGLTFLSNFETEKSLKRALASEENLELKVEKRTQELKQSQLETFSAMSQTYELGKVAQGLFHDLITPLTSVALYVSEYDRTNTKQYIEKAVQASDRMRRMLEVTKSQIEVKNEYTIFSALKEIEISKDLQQYSARKKNVTITVTPNNDLFLYGVELRFNQIISNIVQNAIEAFEDACTNSINIDISDTVITISNNGPQIPLLVLSNLFTTSLSTKQGHFGIGLPSIKNILTNDFQGTLDIKSSIEETKFILNFPHAKVSKSLSTIIQGNKV